MIPIEKQSLFTPIIYGLLNGQPLLTQILCISLEKEGWTTTKDELAKILTFPTGMGLERKVRTLLRNFIPDNDGTVHDVYWQQGRSFHPNGRWKDPHVSFKIGKKVALLLGFICATLFA